MKHFGKCNCGKSKVLLEGANDLGALTPRVCDCEFCTKNPSAVVSDPSLTFTIILPNGEYSENNNGSGQAVFYHCKSCNQLLAVGAVISGSLLGALNAHTLDDREQLGESVNIQPWLLSPKEKIERWSRLWGKLNIEIA